MKFINIGGLRHSYKNFLKKVVTVGNSEEPAILAADSTVNPTKVVTAMCKDDDPDSCVIQVANIKENKNITITDSGIVKQTGDTAGKETEVFNTAGGTTDLSPAIKKVKYIKKERRNFFHKSIPISFYIDEEGNYNPQINGRYEDWYYSKCPVFRIERGKKFRMFIHYEGNGDTNLETYKELSINDLCYWSVLFTSRFNLIEKSGDALICNQSNNRQEDRVLICPSRLTNDDLPWLGNIVGHKIQEIIYEEDTYYIYILIKDEIQSYKAKPYNKNLKWVGNRIECIIPTNCNDILNVLTINTYHYISTFGIRSSNSVNSERLNKISIRYPHKKRCINTKYKKFRYVKRNIHNGKDDIKLKTRINIIRTTYKNFRKQPSMFYIHSYCKDRNKLTNYIKRME